MGCSNRETENVEQRRLALPKLEKDSEYEREKLQHEFKVHMEQYFKRMLGKGTDHIKVVIWDDMMIIRGEGFLTEPEKYIARHLSGKDEVRAARMQVSKQHVKDNMKYFEERLGAKAIHQAYEIEAENDFWIHTIVFDRVLFGSK